jgi:hypothetical protein
MHCIANRQRRLRIKNDNSSPRASSLVAASSMEQTPRLSSEPCCRLATTEVQSSVVNIKEKQNTATARRCGLTAMSGHHRSTVEIPFFRHCLPPLLEALSQLRHPGLHMAVASSAPRYAALHKNEHVTGSTCSPLHKSRDKKKIANHQPQSHLPNGRRS